jgi:hypothetical protein
MHIPHRHGTAQAYRHSCCRQTCCKIAYNIKYSEERRLKNNESKLTTPLIDAENTKNALLKLKSLLGTWVEVGQVVGLQRTGLAKIAKGLTKEVLQTTEARVITILATMPLKEKI